MGRALKLGALFGIPGVFLVTGMIGILGGAGLGPSALIGGWCGFFGGGIYLGGIAFLPRDHEIYARPPRPTVTTPAPTDDAAAVAVDTTSAIAMVRDSVTTR